MIEARRRSPARAQRERAPRRLRAGAGGRRGLRRRAQAGRRLRRRAAGDDDLHEERHRGDQPRRLFVGSGTTRMAGERRPRRRGADHADGAPREHRALAGALPRARRGAALPGGRRARRGLARSTRRRARTRRRAHGRGHTRLERARHDPPGRRDRRAGARRGRGVFGGRRPGGAAHAGRRRGDRRRLLRVDRPQGARADGDRRAARPARDPRVDGAVPDRRRHDRLGRLPVGHLERAAVQVRGRHPADRRGRRAGRGRRVPVCGSAWTVCAHTSAR